MDELLSIGEFSARCGLTPKVLRTYAAAGLLTPAAVDRSSGYHYYEPAQVHEASVVGLLRRAGVSLAEIAAFLSNPTPSRWGDGSTSSRWRSAAAKRRWRSSANAWP